MNSDFIRISLLSAHPDIRLCDRYLQLIDSFRDNNASLDDATYTEDHHILPRSIFPEYAELKIHRWNSIALTARQHFIVHWILAKMFIRNEDKKNMKLAFWCMCFKSKNRISSRVFEQARIQMTESLRGRIRMHRGEEEKSISPELIEQFLEEGWTLGKHPKNTPPNRWINNGISHKRVFDDEFQKYIDDGWKPGNLSSGNLGKIWVNDGNIVKCLSKEKASDMIQQGWRLGKIEGTGARGLISINNGTKTIRVKPDIVDQYKSEGWVVGHTNKPNDGKLYVNDGTRCIVVSVEEHDRLISEGWIHGMLPRTKPKKFFINRDGVAIKVIKEEIDRYVSDGWRIGMGPKRNKHSSTK